MDRGEIFLLVFILIAIVVIIIVAIVNSRSSSSTVVDDTKNKFVIPEAYIVDDIEYTKSNDRSLISTKSAI